MSLSIEKLHTILEKKGLLLLYCYYYKKKYRLLETLSVKNKENIIIAIPDQYEFYISKSSEEIRKLPHYKLYKTDFDEKLLSTTEKYGHDGEIDLNSYYLELELKDETNSENIEQHLLKKYDDKIQFSKDIKKLHNLKENYMQVKRLSYCVKNLNYKIAILYDNNILFLDANNKINCYDIRGGEDLTKKRRLFGVIDLENLLKNDHIDNDIKDLQVGIRKMLYKNQTGQTKMIKKLIENYSGITIQLENIDRIKKDVDGMIDEYTKLIDKVDAKIANIQKTGDTLIELKSLEDYREKMSTKILELNDYISDITLRVDKIFFNNIVLLKSLQQNVEELKKLFYN